MPANQNVRYYKMVSHQQLEPTATHFYRSVQEQTIFQLIQYIKNVCHVTAHFKPIFHLMQCVFSWYGGSGLDPLSSVLMCTKKKKNVDKWLLMEAVNGRLYSPVAFRSGQQSIALRESCALLTDCMLQTPMVQKYEQASDRPTVFAVTTVYSETQQYLAADKSIFLLDFQPRVIVIGGLFNSLLFLSDLSWWNTLGPLLQTCKSQYSLRQLGSSQTSLNIYTHKSTVKRNKMNHSVKSIIKTFQ